MEQPSPRASVKGSAWEPPDLGAGNGIWLDQGKSVDHPGGLCRDAVVGSDLAHRLDFRKGVPLPCLELCRSDGSRTT